jgi:hypothetical protein
MRSSALQKRLTRKYPRLLYMMNFVRQQNDNAFCVLYALNNIIECSPFVFDKTPFTVPDMVDACKEVYKDDPRRTTCNKYGFFTFKAVNWLLDYYPVLYPISQTTDRQYIIGHEDDFHLPPDLLFGMHFSRTKALFDLDRNLMSVGFMMSVKNLTATGFSEHYHVIAIINLQPLTLKNVNFVAIDSERRDIYVSSNFDTLYKYLNSNYKLDNPKINIVRKIISRKTAEELKSLHEESLEQVSLEAGHSHYFF